MEQYSIIQWIAFFFVYCFAGWVWECLYVSILKRKWVNRGFLSGPLLPIYGFGATSMLLFTIPFQKNIIGIFFFGMVGATVLEYITGAVMERIFHIRYWDYSNQKCNLNGYICLSSSLVWGVFSVLLVKVLHQYVVSFINLFSQTTLGVVVLILLSLFMWDVVHSAIEALDLKNILLRQDAISKEIQLIQKRLDVLAAIITADSEKIKNKLSKYRIETDILKQKLSILGAITEARKDNRYRRAARILKRNPGSTSRQHFKSLDDIRKMLNIKK